MIGSSAAYHYVSVGLFSLLAGTGHTHLPHGSEIVPGLGYRPPWTVAVSSAPTIAGSTAAFGKGFPAV
jgi:hypothetical protein